MTNKTDQVWYALEITAEPQAAEAIEFAFNELESIGTEINHLRRKDEDDVKVIGYFYEVLDDQTREETLEESLRVYGFSPDVVKNTEWRRIGYTDWLYDWKQHWKPTEVGRFIVSPPWEKVNAPEKHVIWIEPNMAFGTGTHETTQLCLNAIGKYYRPGESFLDVGTGTGILVIGAAKLAGGRPDAGFLACDTDEGSIAIARENAVLNEVGDSIEFYVGTISEETPNFDFVCANLTIDVITPLLPLLSAKARKTLLLSGILAEQEAEISAELNRLEVADFSVERSGEWISVVVSKQRTP